MYIVVFIVYIFKMRLIVESPVCFMDAKSIKYENCMYVDMFIFQLYSWRCMFIWFFFFFCFFLFYIEISTKTTTDKHHCCILESLKTEENIFAAFFFFYSWCCLVAVLFDILCILFLYNNIVVLFICFRFKKWTTDFQKIRKKYFKLHTLWLFS